MTEENSEALAAQQRLPASSATTYKSSLSSSSNSRTSTTLLSIRMTEEDQEERRPKLSSSPLAKEEAYHDAMTMMTPCQSSTIPLQFYHDDTNDVASTTSTFYDEESNDQEVERDSEDNYFDAVGKEATDSSRTSPAPAPQQKHEGASPDMKIGGIAMASSSTATLTLEKDNDDDDCYDSVDVDETSKDEATAISTTLLPAASMTIEASTTTHISIKQSDTVATKAAIERDLHHHHHYDGVCDDDDDTNSLNSSAPKRRMIDLDLTQANILEGKTGRKQIDDRQLVRSKPPAIKGQVAGKVSRALQSTLERKLAKAVPSTLFKKKTPPSSSSASLQHPVEEPTTGKLQKIETSVLCKQKVIGYARNRPDFYNKVVRPTSGEVNYYFVLYYSEPKQELTLVPMEVAGTIRRAGERYGRPRFRCVLQETSANWLIGQPCKHYTLIPAFMLMKTRLIVQEAWDILETSTTADDTAPTPVSSPNEGSMPPVVVGAGGKCNSTKSVGVVSPTQCNIDKTGPSRSHRTSNTSIQSAQIAAHIIARAAEVDSSADSTASISEASLLSEDVRTSTTKRSRPLSISNARLSKRDEKKPRKEEIHEKMTKPPPPNRKARQAPMSLSMTGKSIENATLWALRSSASWIKPYYLSPKKGTTNKNEEKTLKKEEHHRDDDTFYDAVDIDVVSISASPSSFIVHRNGDETKSPFATLDATVASISKQNDPPKAVTPTKTEAELQRTDGNRGQTPSFAALAEEKRRVAEIHIHELCDSIAFKPLHDIEKGLMALFKKDISANRVVERKGLNGSLRAYNALLVWAADRYEAGAYCHEIKRMRKAKPFLSQMKGDEKNLDEDAMASLNLLLQSNAQAHTWFIDTQQSPLHICMENGFPHCVKALVRQVKYDLDKISRKDSYGDSVVHSALSNGNFDCASIILFPVEYLGQAIHQTENLPRLHKILDTLEDEMGDNILSALVRYTDVSYDDSSITKTDSKDVVSKSYSLLAKIIDRLKATNYLNPLINKNHEGENVAAVAARCGAFHELKLLLSIKFMEDMFSNEMAIPVANVCTRADEYGSANVKSPLDLAKRTKELMQRNLSRKTGGSLADFENAGLFGFEDYVRNNRLMTRWMVSIDACISYLERIERSVPCDLETVRKYRQIDSTRRLGSGRAAFVLRQQSLTPLAQMQKDLMTQSFSSKHKIQLDCPSFMNLSRQQKEKARFSIKAILLENKNVPQHLTPKLIRNPQDPCHRASLSLKPHFGLFATRKIPKHTILCEYSGEVRGDNEAFGGYQAAPEYVVKLEHCDNFILSKTNDRYSDTFVLDAEWGFNEGSLINDHRWSLAWDDDVNVVHRKENVKFVEVVVNAWPHIFIMSIASIAKDEEILMDYGPDYWEKVENERLRKQDEEKSKRLRDLERELLARNGSNEMPT